MTNIKYKAGQAETVKSIMQRSSYFTEEGEKEAYNLYTMEIKYDYSIGNVITNFTVALSDDADIDEEIEKSILKEVFDSQKVDIRMHPFGCTAFGFKGVDNKYRMGRNYDFATNTSAMLVYCNPKPSSRGEMRYKSVAFAALANIDANNPITKRDATLVTPFVCLDGMNEKGVSIAVLVVDSRPTVQYDKKPNIFTTLAIRLVLDEAASTKEAINLLNKYNMFASGLKDYHFMICDSNGDRRVVEYNYLKHKTRELVDTVHDVVTNHYIFDEKHKGHGQNRCEIVDSMLRDKEISKTNEMAWNALQASSQINKPGDPTSNTQWSIVYNNSDLI